jgi:hypothetical protein
MSYAEITLICVAVAGSGFFVVQFLFKQDTAREGRRRGAAQMALKLSELGLTKTPEFLIDYSVGDYSAMAAKLKDVGKTFLAGDAAVIEEFGKLFERVLAAKLNSETGRAYIAAKLTDAAQPEDVEVIQVAPMAEAR